MKLSNETKTAIALAAIIVAGVIAIGVALLVELASSL